MDHFHVYKDIEARTGGEIYVALWDLCAPENPHLSNGLWSFSFSRTSRTDRKRPRPGDELFPECCGEDDHDHGAEVYPEGGGGAGACGGDPAKVRLIDCVGFMVEGAGHTKTGRKRLVKTPWYDYEIPFTQAAEIGDEKGDPGPFHHRDRCGLRWQLRGTLQG